MFLGLKENYEDDNHLYIVYTDRRESILFEVCSSLHFSADQHWWWMIKPHMCRVAMLHHPRFLPTPFKWVTSTTGTTRRGEGGWEDPKNTPPWMWKGKEYYQMDSLFCLIGFSRFDWCVFNKCMEWPHTLKDYSTAYPPQWYQELHQ